MRGRSSSYFSALREEFKALIGDEGVLLILFIAPLLYGVIYTLCYAPEELRKVPIATVDLSQTPLSRHLIRAVGATPEVEIKAECGSSLEAEELLYAEEVYGIMLIPPHYAEELLGATQTKISLWLDTSYFLRYRTLFEGLSRAILYNGAEIEVMRLSLSGSPLIEAEVKAQPIRLHQHNLYNPTLGYGRFIMPAILVLILQQLIWVGIGMRIGTLREGRMGSLSSSIQTPRVALLAQIGAILLLIALPALYLFTLHYRLFDLPMRGATGSILLILLLYLVAVILSGRVLASLFHRRIDPLLWLLWGSIPILLLSGASIPSEAIPSWVQWLAALLPSTPAIRAFVASQSMGATLQELHPELLHLLLLLLLYGLMALYIIQREQRKRIHCSH